MVETKGAPLRLARAFFSKRLAPVVYTGWRLWELRELFNTVRLLGPPMTGMVLPQVALAIKLFRRLEHGQWKTFAWRCKRREGELLTIEATRP